MFTRCMNSLFIHSIESRLAIVNMLSIVFVILAHLVFLNECKQGSSPEIEDEGTLAGVFVVSRLLYASISHSSGRLQRR